MKTKCEICGEMVPQQDMSKSYKHRCKKCVARLTRIDRLAAKQRAENIRQQLEGTGYTLVSPEERRRERIQIATAAMQGMIMADMHYNSLMDMKGLAVTSLKFADALLAEVDKEEEGGSDE